MKKKTSTPPKSNQKARKPSKTAPKKKIRRRPIKEEPDDFSDYDMQDEGTLDIPEDFG